MKTGHIKQALMLPVFLLLFVVQLVARDTVNFNADWRFALGEQADAVLLAAFDDAEWQTVRLPHDWAIAGPFDPEANGSTGKLPWQGVGWYRKTFTLDASDEGQRVYFDFDGIMAFPKIYINGQLAGEWDYGYMSFRVDATPYVRFGEENIIAVQVDTREHRSRWYPGAGIYRKVTMTLSDPVHIAHWGTFVTTPEVSDAAATVNVRTTVENHRESASRVTVEYTLVDPQGRTVAKGSRVSTLPGGSSRDIDLSLTVENPQRWDINTPHLYTARVAVREGGRSIFRLFAKQTDSEDVSFGIRTFQFTTDDGFHLNGQRVQLFGVNLHHDQGPLGAVFNVRAMERQLEIMQDMGVNALRTSHNAPAPEVLDLCDRLGIVVWDEAFDKWDDTADRLEDDPLEEHGEQQLRNLVMRDRNHPSVVLWSIGNEIGTQAPGTEGDGKNHENVTYMREFVLKYDPTRPVTIGNHIEGDANSDVLDALDVVGYNYGRRYEDFRETHLDVPIIYSESASTLSTRGFYEFPLPESKTDYSDAVYQVDSYDYNAAAWSDIPDQEFLLMEQDSFVAGEFVWTGFDYLGEPTPFTQQARSSYFGIVDLMGIPKDRYYLYRSYWRPDVTTIHILPHWNWPDRVGQPVPVYVYTNGDEAELFLNGRSLGRRTKSQEISVLVNLAEGRPVQASSEEVGNPSGQGNDDDGATSWLASVDDTEPWWQIDLGEMTSVRQIDISFDRQAGISLYEVAVSRDGSTWETVISVTEASSTGRGFFRQPSHNIDAIARYLRIIFHELQPRPRFTFGGAQAPATEAESPALRAGIQEVSVYSRNSNEVYYEAVERYRLHWDEVIYEPGELRVVAYKDGNVIGEAVMRTADEMATLKLTPDREEIAATGDDLCYILVEAFDANGTPQPLADQMINFEVVGPAEIAGIGNGNPLSLEPFQDDSHSLFYGKAMLILRSIESEAGVVRVIARSEGLPEATATLRTVQ